MRASMFSAYALCAVGALAQTPPGSIPSTNTDLGVSYGSTAVTPNILLSESFVATQPTLHSDTTYPSTYMLLLVDLSIPFTSIHANATSNLVPGLQPNRTTRLHWWTLDVKQSPNGTFSTSNSNSTTPALYGGPMPPAGDIPHTYTFYLLPQPLNYSIPTAAQQAIYNPTSAYTRMNFSIEALVAAVGEPVAANYIRVHNANSSSGGAATTTAPTNATAAMTGTAVNGSMMATASASAASAIYTGAAGRILAANAALIAVGICMFVWL